MSGNGTRTSNAEQVALLSDLVGRFRLAQRAGFQFAGARDIYEVAGYKKELKFADYWDRYDRGHVAGRIVDMPAKATWKKPPTVVEEGKEDGPFADAFAEFAKRHGLWRRLERADRLSRIGHYGVLLIGQAGDDVQLAQPLERMSGPDDVIYLSAFHEKHADINTWVSDPGDPRFGMPETYKLDLASGVAKFEAKQVIVHASRCVHIAEDLLADEVYGRPALRRVFNLLMDLEKITAATAEAYWQLADRILQAKIDKDVQIPDGALDSLDDQLQELFHDLRRTFYGQGTELEWIGGESPDPSGAADLYLMLLAAAAGIPKRILFGSETGERASTQDERQWLGSIRERQEAHAEPGILRPLVDRLIEYGALPPVKAYDVQWENLYSLDEQEESELSKARAETAKALTPVGGDPSELVEIDQEGVVHLRPSETEGA